MKISIKNAIAGIFGNSFNSVLDYLKNRHPLRMLLDGLFIITVSWGVGGAYIVATNFTMFATSFGLHDPEKMQEDLKTLVKNNRAINSILTEVLNQTNAGRSNVFMFHNGKQSLDNRSFFFRSMTHQAVKPGVTSTLQESQNIPASINTHQLETLLAGECFIYVPTKEANAFNDLLIRVGTDKIVQCPIYNINENVIGFIGVAYIDKTDQKESDEKINEYLRKAAEKLKYLL